jgi:hypothetical protein
MPPAARTLSAQTVVKAAATPPALAGGVDASAVVADVEVVVVVALISERRWEGELAEEAVVP